MIYHFIELLGISQDKSINVSNTTESSELDGEILNRSELTRSLVLDVPYLAAEIGFDLSKWNLTKKMLQSEEGDSNRKTSTGSSNKRLPTKITKRLSKYSFLQEVRSSYQKRVQIDQGMYRYCN
jgi:hypothetical protein